VRKSHLVSFFFHSRIDITSSVLLCWRFFSVLIRPLISTCGSFIDSQHWKPERLSFFKPTKTQQDGSADQPRWSACKHWFQHPCLRSSAHANWELKSWNDDDVDNLIHTHPKTYQPASNSGANPPTPGTLVYVQVTAMENLKTAAYFFWHMVHCQWIPTFAHFTTTMLWTMKLERKKEHNYKDPDEVPKLPSPTMWPYLSSLMTSQRSWHTSTEPEIDLLPSSYGM